MQYFEVYKFNPKVGEYSLVSNILLLTTKNFIESNNSTRLSFS